MRVLFLGPPGAGKGTQARFLEQRYGGCQVSTGDILRKAVRDQTALGKRAAEHLHRGELVPDEVMVHLVAERLRAQDCQRGFILDGFPRTVAQAEGLGAILRDIGSEIDAVLYLQVPHSTIIQRLAGRRTCQQCGQLYHVVFDPPSRRDLCDQCGGDLHQREDDREETVAARLQVYESQTAPLIHYYRQRGLLREIDGAGSMEEIQARVLQALGDAGT